MELSVIMPCYNGAATIETQLKALARQQWSKSWEVIIADNGSTDSSREIIERYRLDIPNLRIIDCFDRQNSAYARNVAIDDARSDRFAFCDIDDEICDGWVATMGEALAQHEFVGCRIDDKKLNSPAIRSLWGPAEDWESLPVILDYLPAAASCGFGFTRQLYNDIGPLDESLIRLHDIDYCWRAQLAGKTLHFLPNAVVHYRYRPTLKGTYRQCFDDAQYEVALYKRYQRFGMTWRPLHHGVRSWVSMARGFPSAAMRKGRARGLWVKSAGVLLGRVVGSVEQRTLAL